MKKTACWLLLLALMALMMLPAGAAEKATGFADAADIRNQYAVQMLVDLTLLSGDGDGNFRPEDPITRAETAKLIARLCCDEPESEGWAEFADTADSWAKDYIAYCASRGIVGGSGGYFRPQDNVTAQELAKMLLVTLGFDAAAYTGAQWAENVNADARENGIYHGFTGRSAEPISRDDACLLIYNAMQCPAIDGYNADGSVRYVLDDLLNRKTFLEVRFDAVRYSAVLTGNEYADLTGTGRLDAGTSKLDGHKAFSVSTELALVGHRTDIYVRGGKILGIPAASVREHTITVRDTARLKRICAGNELTFTPETRYYKDYAETDAAVLDSLGSDAVVEVIDHDGDGWVDVVLVLSGCFEATVTETEPLRVQGSAKAARFSQSGSLLAGETRLCWSFGGTTYVLPN